MLPATRALFEAVETCDLPALTGLLASPRAQAVAHRKTGDDSTALMTAARLGWLEGLQALLPYSDATAANAVGTTALRSAIVSRSTACVQALIPHCDLSATGTDAQTFAFAARLGDLEGLRLLVGRSDLSQWTPGQGGPLLAQTLWVVLDTGGHVGAHTPLLDARTQSIARELLSHAPPKQKEQIRAAFLNMVQQNGHESLKPLPDGHVRLYQTHKGHFEQVRFLCEQGIFTLLDARQSVYGLLDRPCFPQAVYAFFPALPHAEQRVALQALRERGNLHDAPASFVAEVEQWELRELLATPTSPASSTPTPLDMESASPLMRTARTQLAAFSRWTRQLLGRAPSLRAYASPDHSAPHADAQPTTEARPESDALLAPALNATSAPRRTRRL